MMKSVIMQRLYIAGKSLCSCAFFDFRQYEGGFKNVLGAVNFLFSLRNPIRKNSVGRRKGGK